MYAYSFSNSVQDSVENITYFGGIFVGLLFFDVPLKFDEAIASFKVGQSRYCITFGDLTRWSLTPVAMTNPVLHCTFTGGCVISRWRMPSKTDTHAGCIIRDDYEIANGGSRMFHNYYSLAVVLFQRFWVRIPSGATHFGYVNSEVKSIVKKTGLELYHRAFRRL